MKILFTSVGRRIELIQAFRMAAVRLGINLQIYGADIALSAPALAYCDRTVIVPRIKDSSYIPELRRICEEEKIDALVPTIDTDLLLLSENRETFGKTKVVISAPDKIALCRNKNLTAAYFRSIGLLCPETVNQAKDYKGGFPAFIKPQDGSSSIFAYKVNDEKELAAYAAQVPDYIIQPFISGTEYTVDIFCDFEGKPVFITPRIRLAVRAGEVLKTQISQDARIIAEMQQLAADFQPCGQITVQLIREEATGRDYYIEINPRFGGGAPLTIKAGADSAEALLRLIGGEVLTYQPQAAEEGSIFSRFDQSVRTDTGFAPDRVKGVIFDLDDTLYSERDYVRSGYHKIAEFLQRPEAEEELWQFFLEGRPAIDAYLEKTGQMGLKEICLDIYRNQTPDISLYPGVKELILRLKASGKKVGIITDGRPGGQRKKLEALGLTDLVDDVIITDELGGPAFRKPNDIAFRMMQCRWGLSYPQMVYIGDNPGKDFQAPRQLGMQSLWYRNPEGLYSDSVENVNVCSIEKRNRLIQLFTED